MVEVAFEGQVAVVTGAGGGLGRTYAMELARRGARVVVNDIGGGTDGTGAARQPADVTVADIVAAGGEAIADYNSVSTPEGGEAIVQSAMDAFGTIDILINNAGTLRDKSFAKLGVEDIRAVLDVHLFGAFHVTQPAYRVMRDHGYGRILFTSSASGIWGNFGQASYAAAKTGLVGLANVLAIEGAKYGIAANVIVPIAKSRLTAEVMADVGDRLRPEFVTPLAVYLVSRECELTHGIFTVGGGRFARVFIGTGSGWCAPEGPASVEDVAANLGRIVDIDDYVIPMSAADETALMAKVLGW